MPRENSIGSKITPLEYFRKFPLKFVIFRISQRHQCLFQLYSVIFKKILIPPLYFYHKKKFPHFNHSQIKYLVIFFQYPNLKKKKTTKKIFTFLIYFSFSKKLLNIFKQLENCECKLFETPFDEILVLGTENCGAGSDMRGGRGERARGCGKVRRRPDPATHLHNETCMWYNKPEKM